MKKEHVFTGVILVLVFALIGLAWYVGSLKRDAANQKNAAASADQLNQRAAANGGEITFRPIDKNDLARGATNPKITILEYSDTECPYCIRFHDTLKQVLSSYQYDVQWVYRFSPIPQLHPTAVPEAQAAFCVAKLNGTEAFWKYLDRIFSTTPGNNGLNPAKLDEYAAELGVNSAEFDTCRNSDEAANRVLADRKDALAAGLQGTPYSLVLGPNGDIIGTIPGYVTFAQLKPKLDEWINTARQ